MNSGTRKTVLGLALLLSMQTAVPAMHHSADAANARMTQYRVYQNDKALREFATQARAVAYAKSFAYSHVEKIADRAWIWDNLPRYVVYQEGKTQSNWAYATYAEALQRAKQMDGVHIRDLEQPGWVYSKHARYRLYQGDKTLPNWSFATLAEAKKQAKFYSNTHVMDLVTNEWVWDNLAAAEKEARRSGEPVYEIVVDGQAVGDTAYSFLLDAIRASNKIAGSEVVNIATKKHVHANIPSYEVFQNGRLVKHFFGLDNAVAYAKSLAGAEIIKEGNVWWTNIPYLQVFQGDKLIRHFHTKSGAIAYAKSYTNAYVKTGDGRAIWNNAKKLLYLGWNGSSRSSTVLGHVANTQGLDIDSPTWFELASADGTLTDSSDPSVVTQLEAKGMQVVPLVHNQFDRKMTSAFLADAAAQKRFITALVSRLTALGVEGVNLDFEEVAAADRDRFTAFVRDLSAAVHAKGLTISIDLLRGDAAWNHKTAYDHEKLATYVDYVIIMAYDQHWKGSTSPGSVAGLEWTEDGVLDYLSYGIPRSKLMLGVPFYVREWKLDGTGTIVDSRAVLMKDVPALLSSVQAKSEFDSRFGQIKYTYAQNGFTYVFWAETEQTIKARIAIAKEYDLAGVAAWRLGYESTDLWTMMLQNK